MLSTARQEMEPPAGDEASKEGTIPYVGEPT
jgi:hypothetical protein